MIPVDSSIMPNGLVARGCLPRTDKCGDVFPIFERDLIEPIPRDQWPELIAANLSSRDIFPRVKKQQYGSCAAHAATNVWEGTQVMTFGQASWIELSPLSVYRITGGGRDRGSTISDNMKQMVEVGALPVPSERNKEALRIMDLDPSHTMGENDWRSSYPDGWKDTAKYFRYQEVYDIESFDGLITALLREFLVEYGRDMHAICGVDPVMESVRSFFIDYVNTWGKGWGDDGFGRDSEAKTSRSIASYGAFAVRTIYIDERLVRYATEMNKRAAEQRAIYSSAL
jgi:hypothetical protein